MHVSPALCSPTILSQLLHNPVVPSHPSQEANWRGHTPHLDDQNGKTLHSIEDKAKKPTDLPESNPC